MGDTLFYHLTRSPAESLLPLLIEKSLKAGWRVELRGTEAKRLDWLDRQLWQGDGFLPHGLAGGAHDARQPVLLTLAGQPAANDPACLIALDGAGVEPAECRALQRVCVIFDGNDGAALARARDQWKELTGAGAATQYWSEDSGRWDRKR